MTTFPSEAWASAYAQRLGKALDARFPNALRTTLLTACASLGAGNHGDFARWAQALTALPAFGPCSVELKDRVRVTACEPVPQQALREALRMLRPWRKGPFDLFGLELDTEWRSDWKWDRIRAAVPWTGQRVLDVGCGNGYFGWRMLGAGARLVIGIDPTLLFCMQHLAIEHYVGTDAALRDRNWVLPLPLEALPVSPAHAAPASLSFDTTLSMGVLYHRREPEAHLQALLQTLRPGGTLLLETLIVASGPDLVPALGRGRYAQMRNVWAVPKLATVQRWLRAAGFADIDALDLSPTSIAEQHATPWMRFASLPDFLDPQDPARTIEGWPAPLRVLLRARRPASGERPPGI